MPTIWEPRERHAQLGVLHPELLGQRRPQLAAQELAQHPCRLRLGGGGAHDAEHARAALGAPEHGGDEAREPLADPLAVALEQQRQHLARLERQPHDLDEQPLLAAEEVGDERLVDAGLGGDAAHRRAVVALRGELAPRGGEDRLARAARAGAPAATPRRGILTSSGVLCYFST